MNKGHFVFESILILVTFGTGVSILFNSESAMWFLIWLQPLGVLQVLHSIIIGTSYWKHPGIRNCISIYWGLVIFDLIALSLMMKSNLGSEAFFFFILPGLPLALALYLWFITLHFRLRKPVTPAEEPLT